MSMSEPISPFVGPDADFPDVSPRWCGTLDRTLIALTIALALLLAAGPIRNSDVWQHLASGRLLAEHPNALGEEPFLHTATGAPWINHGWLFDLTTFVVYSITGESGLWALRLLMVLILAAALLRAGHRPNASWWAPATFAVLALLTATPRFGWEPRLFSLVFLAVTVALLERHDAGRRTVQWLPLLVMFVLWANVDGWFLLGPLAVFCYWLGGLAKPTRTVPFWLVPAATATGLLTPHLHRAFVFPAEMTFPLTYPHLAHVPFFRSLFLSPLGADFYLSGAATAWTSLAFLTLVGLGLVSFVMNRRTRPWDRALLWLALLALSAYQVRNAPFFAIAAGPLAALNLQEYAARRRREEDAEPRPRQAVIGRFGTVVAGLALVALAIFGRLPPAVAGLPDMRIETEPSLARAATRLAQARAQGWLPNAALGFNLAPEMAQYGAWFGPAEKGFFDTRLEVSGPAAADFAVVREGLTGPIGAASPDGAPSWRAVLRRRGVDHVIVCDRDAERTGRALARLSAEPGEWVLHLQAGRVAVFSRGEAGTGKRFAAPGVDSARRAFRPGAAERAPATPPQTPEPAWWDTLLPTPMEPSLDRDEATMQLLLFEARKGPTRRMNGTLWEASLAVGALGGAAPLAGPGGPLASALQLHWQRAAGAAAGTLGGSPPPDRFALDLHSSFLSARDEAPVGHMWAAVRAARRRLAENPRDAHAHLLLGKAYCRLAWNTRERAWGPALPLLSQLRRQQALTALHAALRLDAGLTVAHRDLADLYGELHYPDLALFHLRVYRAAAPPGETPTRRDRRLEETDRLVAGLERELQRAESEYESQAAALGAAARAHLAERLGLGKQALDQLLAIDVAGFGRQGMLTQLELMLCAGRGAEARAWIDPETHKDFLGPFEYHWLQARLAATAGDYVAAEANLAELATGPNDDPVAGLIGAVAAEILRGTAQAGISSPYAVLNPLANRTHSQIIERSQALRQEVSLSLLRGLLHLEQGDVDRAAQLFRRARDLSAQEPERSPGSAAANVARQLLVELAAAD